MAATILVTSEAVRRRTSDLLDVVQAGTSVIVERHSKPVARLVPCPPEQAEPIGAPSVSAVDVRRQSRALLDRAMLGGASIVTRRGVPVAQIVPHDPRDGDATKATPVELVSDRRFALIVQARSEAAEADQP